MNAYALDFYRTSDLRDTSRDDALEQIHSELMRDDEERIDALNNIDAPNGLLNQALLTGNGDLVLSHYETQMRDRLWNRAVELLNEREARV